MERLIQDARYALRSLRRTPAFTAAAVVTLMLGIGATTAIFTVINATLLRPLPYPDPDRLTQVMRRYPTGTERGQTGRRYLFFRDHLTSVSALAAWRGPTGVNLALGDRAEYVKAMSVSKEFFYGLVSYAVSQRTRELGIRMALGATRHGIIMSVVTSSATLALAGVAAGAGAALAFTRTLRTVVWGIGTGDPATFIGVAAILLLVAILSSLIPVLRAVRLDPASALRE